MHKNFRHVAWLTLFGGSLAAGVSACGSGTDTTAIDAAVDAASDASGDAVPKSLFDKYGGAPTVTKLVNDSLNAVTSDCSLTPYFAVVGTPGHDSVAQLGACLELQFTALLGGPATYPGVNKLGVMCKDMTTIHAGLGIPQAAFDQFIGDLGTVLVGNGVDAQDITTIATALKGTAPQIVSKTSVSRTACGMGPEAGPADAAVSDGGDAAVAGDGASPDGAVGSLYEKYGGAATVAKVVDDAVTGLLGDCSISPYFAVVGTAGHDTADKLKSCLRLQFTALMGGPAVYPGKNDMGTMCADMTSIHAGLGIPGPVFDKFISDLGAVLAADHVEAADITTMATALMPLKTQIVSPTPVTKTACDGGI